MKNLHLFSCVLILISSTACQAVEPTLVSTHTTLAQTPTQAPPSATATRESTATLQPTTTPTPVPPIHRSCIEIIDPPVENENLDGVIFVDARKDGMSDYLLDLGNNKTIDLGQTIDAVIEQRSGLIAYIDIRTNSIVIMERTGRKIHEISDPDHRLAPMYWLNDGILALNRINWENDQPFRSPSLVLYHLASGTQEEFFPNFPDIDQEMWLISWQAQASFVIAPIQDYAIYKHDDGIGTYALYDRNSSKIIAMVKNADWGWVPQWSFDGSTFVTSARPVDETTWKYSGTELLTVNVDGNIRELTHFSQYGGAVQHRYQWRPGGDRAIGFFLEFIQGSDLTNNLMHEFAIINLQNRWVRTFCIPGFSFVWSYGGDFVIVNQSFDQGVDPQAYILDLRKNVAWKIVKNGEVMGWVR